MISVQEAAIQKTDDVEIKYQSVLIILMDGYEYSFNRMVGDAQKWKCTNKSCYAYFKIMDNHVLPGIMTHTHPPSVEASSQDANHKEVNKDSSPKQQVQSSVVHESEGSGGKRAYPFEERSDPSRSSQQEAPSSGAKKIKVKLPTGKTVMRRASPPIAAASSPRSGVASVDSGPSCQVAASPSCQVAASPAFPRIASPSTQVTDSPAHEQVASPSYQVAAFPAFQNDASPAHQVAASPVYLDIASPADQLATSSAEPLTPHRKNPKLSEIGPPLTPPLSQNSSQHDSDPSSPPPIIDLVETKYEPFSSWSPDCMYYLNSPAEANPSQPSSPSEPRSNCSEKLTKYKEYENAIMKLGNGTFGQAVTSLLCELPAKVAEDVRLEIATLLYCAVEESGNSRA